MPDAMIEQLHASAGSGKTYRLTRRFLALLMASGTPGPACGAQPDQAYGPEAIQAITFTNRAAAEMRQRVLGALKALALGQPDPEFQRPEDRRKALALLERLLRHYQTLDIRTIDSLLGRLARLFALELGLPPDFETSLDQDAVFDDLFDALTAGSAELSPQARTLMEAMADSLAESGSSSGFWLTGAVRERLRGVFAHLVEHGPAPAWDARAARGEADALRDDVIRKARDLRLALEAAGAKPASNFAKYLDSLENLPSLGAMPESAYSLKDSIEDCLLAASKRLVTPEMEQRFAELKHRCRAARERGALLALALAWKPFLDFGNLLLEAFEAYRGDKGVALLSQLPAGVAALLAEAGGVPEAWCRLGSRLHHMLIDEFQDTSRGQWSVLAQLAGECLSKGGSLFYVGDVKQAIYGWRGGEAGLFEAAARDPALTAMVPEPRRETLGRNWRSAPEIVSFNNRVFSALAAEEPGRLTALTLLPEATEPEREALRLQLAQAFADCAQDTPPGREGARGLVRVRFLPGETSGEHEEAVREAFQDLVVRDLLARRDPSDVAVLTRTNGEAAKAAQWLVDLDVPVVTENSLRLAEHPVVRGAVSFLAFLDYPPDNMALWGFLSCRELFCRSQGQDPRALADWLAAQAMGPLYRRFRTDFPDAWKRLVEPFLKGAGPAGPYDLVWELFEACKVFEAYPEDEVFLRRFLELVHNAETQGLGSLSSFLEFWREHGGEEKIPQPEDARAVRVLTIHKAKGLEFPVAVAPFHLFPPARTGRMARIDLNGTPVTVPLRKELGEACRLQTAKDLLEQMNLLYVAWTRPVEELHVFLPAAGKLENRHPLAKAARLLLQAAGHPGGEDVVLGVTPPSQALLVPSPAPAPHAQDHPAPPEPLAAGTPLDWLPGLKISRGELGDPADRLRLTERARGVALHKALELHRPGEPARGAVERALALSGLDDPEAARDLAEGLEWLLAQEVFAPCLHLGLREAELLDADGRVHRPDLLAFTPARTLVVDYKTGREDPAHHEQLRRYLDLAQALPQGEGRPALGILAYVDLRVLREVLPGGAS
ncbi:ATP-dependent helicase/nuclease subunit A [Fundidesulfovibrio magnetotacticus]|uniref:DNA 3'-5' helicase n=1 Tax=Fundidesulfovibrio magnetotacticus TaxID=2730080 RepID=A0A6V8LXE0_9BACT|nr:UvrD-helicase domain-containing protein [Fundidesulfovibrio magnetotacticus]GFK94317.1 ATP-dependent helicase/nuclease subunit A [Fundidesulfovibrio magnetotacticus]